MPSPARNRQVNVFQAIALLVAFLLVAGIGGLLTAGLVMPAVAGASAVTQGGVRFFEELPTELERGPLAEQSRIRNSEGSVMATFYAENRIVVPLDKIAPVMQEAVIATEDRRFREHNGIDAEGMMRAFINNLTTDTVQGGSTLTQQYVKNVLIESAHAAGDEAGVAAARDDTYERKLREAKLAIALEKQMTKDEILEGYLNIAQFGPSVYGVETAARYYFSTRAENLELVQAATLAGITQSPNQWDPEKYPENAERRRNTVLRLMYEQGMITRAEYTEARDTPIEETLDISGTRLGCAAAGRNAYFCDYVTKIIMNDPTFGETRADRFNLLMRGGLDIYTTLDPRMQKAAHEEVRRTVPQDDSSGLAHALVTIEPGTGKVLAMAQNRTYNPRENPSEGETAVNYNTDYEYGGSSGFQIGSTYKPFTLAEWLRSGKSLHQQVDARKYRRNLRDFTACGSPYGPGTWEPGNADGRASGHISVLQATAHSVNTAYVDMASQLDLCKIRDTAATIGLHRGDHSELSAVPSTTLGADEVSPLTLAAAYATFATGGTYCEPIAITRVVDKEGNELDIPPANCRQVLEPDVAAAVTHALQAVMTQGSGRAAALRGRPSAGKTGTAQDNWHAWFAGYTPQLSTVVWLGNPDKNEPMQHVRINGQYYSYVYGGTLPAPTWGRYMSRVTEGMEVKGFPQVTNKMLYGDMVTVPNIIGRSEDDARAMLAEVGFRMAVADDRVHSDDVPRGAVARASTPPGTRAVVNSLITVTLSSGPEERERDRDDDRDGPGRGRGPDNGRPDNRGPDRDDDEDD